MKTCWVIRGLPGSGKTSIAKKLVAQLSDARVVEADEYFYQQDGSYQFDASKLKLAHEWCFDQFKKIVDDVYSNVIVSNTSTMCWEFERYKKYAEENSYMVHVLICENYHNGENVHNVPSDKINQMKNRFEINL